VRKTWEYEFETTLSDTAKAIVGYDRDGAKVTDYRIQLVAVVGGTWKQIMRWDTGHGGPHRDVYRGPDGAERSRMLVDSTYDPDLGYAEAMTASQNDMRCNWETYCDSYKQGEWAYG